MIKYHLPWINDGLGRIDDREDQNMFQKELLMKVTEVKFNAIKGGGNGKAYCDVTFDNALVVKGFKIVEGEKGLFVGFPSQKGGDGKWYPTVKTITKEANAALQEAILAHYDDYDQKPQRSNKPEREERPRRRNDNDGYDNERPPRRTSKPADDDIF